MLTKDQLNFLLQALTAKNPQGQPLISVGVEHAMLAATTFAELERQQADNRDVALLIDRGEAMMLLLRKIQAGCATDGDTWEDIEQVLKPLLR